MPVNPLRAYEIICLPGVSDKITEHYIDKVILAFLHEVETNKKSMSDAYMECCRRFNECMRSG